KIALKEHKKSVRSSADEIDVSDDVIFLENANFKLMQEAGRKKVRENPETFSVIVTNGSIFGIGGEQCPVNVEHYVKTGSEMLGGRYGGKNNEFSGGGPLKEKSRDAYEKIKKMIG
ncbi:hypothetical protein H0N95_00630, partial [Candidatus Micrarchaeota archaeon]|nr:hypothetical protein [Candidatus Micrarchaeota archaeon]